MNKPTKPSTVLGYIVRINAPHDVTHGQYGKIVDVSRIPWPGVRVADAIMGHYVTIPYRWSELDIREE